MKIIENKTKNGIKLIVIEMPDVRSVATMCFVKTGSRNETEEINGISHFLEHMVFKATKKFKNQLEVARAIEGIGGQLNAWTDQDHTNYYNIVPSRFAERGMEVVSELVCNPLLKAEDLEKERGVILEEMNRRADSPDDFVWELAIEQMWPDQPLGWPVVGQKSVIKNVKIAQFKKYREKWYRPNNMVLVVAGNIKNTQAVNLAEKYFGKLKPNTQTEKPIQANNFQKQKDVNIFKKPTDQAHLVLGIKTFDRFDEDRYALSLLNTILGSGMSSRLFMEIREKRGLCYSVHSAIEFYEDTGGIFVHSGLNCKQLEEAVAAICNEIARFKNEDVLEHELLEAQQLIAGHLDMSADSSSALATIFGKQQLLDGKILSIDEIINKYKAVTRSDIRRVANRIFNVDQANLSIIAPLNPEYKQKLIKKIIF